MKVYDLAKVKLDTTACPICSAQKKVTRNAEPNILDALYLPGR